MGDAHPRGDTHTVSLSPRPPAHRGGRGPTGRDTGRTVVGPAVVAAVMVLLLVCAAAVWVANLVSSATTDADAPLPTDDAGPAPTTPALSFVGFDAGDIMSDAVFFDATTMDERQIAAFIDTWNAGCRTGSDGSPCLADYREDTASQPADAWCPGGFEGTTGDTAAAVISKAARGCGINPQVLLTILQKEQGLLTASGDSLDATRYRSAMGYACPDGSDCDPVYADFSRQVWFAARQFQIYRSDPASFGVIPGQSVAIRFAPNPSCGSAEVTVLNQATAGLYAYTPYQPDEAAMLGGVDSCASFGNLNFYAYFTAWFGSTH